MDEKQKPSSPSPLPSDLQSEIDDLVRRGSVIDAIKKLRLATGHALAECAKWVTKDLDYPKPAAPCPQCGKPLKTDLAKQCSACGADWHVTGEHQ
jgi:hypothetical protein